MVPRIIAPRSYGNRVASFVSTQTFQPARSFASVVGSSPITESGRKHKIVVVGGGSAGLTISNQLLRTGQFASEDIALVDPAEWHHYQPGWTLVGGGLKQKSDLRRKLPEMVDPKVRFYNNQVQGFAPEDNTVSLSTGDRITYEHLIVCPGIKVDFNSIKGLSEAVSDPHAPVSSIYSYDTCDKASRNIADLKDGQALFTHPAGPVKCAGAPQKIMWLALDSWKRSGLYNPDSRATSPIKIDFATAMPVMFGVPKYSSRLEELRVQRGVEALFQHDLVGIEGNTAVLNRTDGGGTVRKHFDMLHATPKMGPHAFIKESALANEAGFVDVDDGTLQHKKFSNVWSCGDASSLPTSKTAAAITAQAPILINNMLSKMQGGALPATYDGYTSCPLLTEYGKVMLAEFKYGAQPKETFGRFVDQGTPSRAFYHLKKDFFPWVYFNSMVKGTWAGPKGWKR
ncbi:hypothetical protein D0860_07857 [Hortaea werneckii]|uniref:FAD/NAD(P)-binding domain-containing protein n=1 Tax=Hortaea werneckii TaxID=91943 RepID=A0A3M7GIB9_HORWE|nr:hypothetical protein D0860_07857 [Hortaea werneckii]